MPSRNRSCIRPDHFFWKSSGQHIRLNAGSDGIELHVLTRDVLIFFAAIIAALEVPDNVPRGRQPGGCRCPRAKEPRKLLRPGANDTGELVLVRHGAPLGCQIARAGTQRRPTGNGVRLSDGQVATLSFSPQPRHKPIRAPTENAGFPRVTADRTDVA